MAEIKKIKRNIVKCLSCGMVLESTYRHDFQMCGCSNQTFVDGGVDYCRIGGVDMKLIKVLTEYRTVEVPGSKGINYDT